MSAAIPCSPGTMEAGRPSWLSWSAFPFRTRFITIDGMRIHYLDEGSGPALLLVGAGQWAFMFRDLILRLRGQFRCLTLDFPGSGLSPSAHGHDNSVPANARILRDFIDALDLQDIALAVHDVGGPVGFLVATGQPGRFRALVISNTFGWPLAGYPGVRRMLKLVSGRPFSVINSVTNAVALFTATSYGVGRNLTKADRRLFLQPWRARSNRCATQAVLRGALRIDPVMADVERSLRNDLADVPVLTIFGRKNDPYGWQDRFQVIFPQAVRFGIADGHHFPLSDDPDACAAAICTWWTQKVTTAP